MSTEEVHADAHSHGRMDLVADGPIPPIEFFPPYSLDFVAHLDTGCYPDENTADLLAAVSRDEEGRRMLDALVIVGLELRLVDN